jgi:3-deoxy-manno-octulosonate cytidylyltransferase (CMP-KDO synthetase)
VYEQAQKALDRVLVATDDKRIFDCVKGFGGDVVMTSVDHTCGTDRVYEAYTIYRNEHFSHLSDDEIVVVNIQGDEPFIEADQIQALLDCFPTEIATLVHPFSPNDTWEDLQNPNYVKVAIAHDEQIGNSIGRALYFSRSVIPYLRGEEQHEWLNKGQYFSHIGLYAYRADVLIRITQMPQSPLEKAESLEQLRWLENGLKIKVAVSHTKSIGIDTPEDLEHAIAYFQQMAK